MGKYDVIVVGGGPAGSSLAIFLGKKWRVLLLEKEKFPRYKVCAGGVPACIEEILPIDFSSIKEREFKTLTFGWRRKRIRLEWDFPVIFTVKREKFDNLLLERARKTCEVRFEKVIDAGDGWVMTEKGMYEGKVIVGADGTGSLIRRVFGLSSSGRWVKTIEAEIPERRDEILMEFFHTGYAWIFPKSDTVAVGAGGLAGLSSPKKMFEFLLEKEKIPGPLKVYHWAYPVFGEKAEWVKGNVLVVGDAGSFANPLSGAGIYSGIFSSLLASRAIDLYLQGEKPLHYYSSLLEKFLLPDLRAALHLSKPFYFSPWISVALGRKRILKYWGKVNGYRKVLGGGG